MSSRHVSEILLCSRTLGGGSTSTTSSTSFIAQCSRHPFHGSGSSWYLNRNFTITLRYFPLLLALPCTSPGSWRRSTYQRSLIKLFQDSTFLTQPWERLFRLSSGVDLPPNNFPKHKTLFALASSSSTCPISPSIFCQQAYVRRCFTRPLLRRTTPKGALGLPQDVTTSSGTISYVVNVSSSPRILISSYLHLINHHSPPPLQFRTQ